MLLNRSIITRRPSPPRPNALRTGAWRIALLVFVLCPFAPSTPAYAQNGGYAKPTLTVGEFYDDNLFMIPGAPPVSDIVSRVSPGLELGYRAPRGHLIGHYTFDAEIYPHNTELNEPFVRQNAGIDALSQITSRVSFATLATYDRTHTPFDLNLTGLTGATTGFAIGRFEADQIVVNPELTAQVTGRTKAVLGYRWLRDGFDNQQLLNPTGFNTFSSWLGEASGTLEHQVTGTTMLGAGYTLRQFGFGNGVTMRSQLFLVGVGHQFSPLTSIEIWAGPRVSPGDVRPEATVALKHHLQRGDLTLNYAQQQGTTLGLLVPVDVQTVNLQLSVQTSRRVTIGISPGYFRTTDGTSSLDVKMYEATGTLTVHITPQFAMNASYSYNRQAGTFGLLDQTLDHQVALLSFTVTPVRGVQF